MAEIMEAKSWEHADVVRISGQSSSVVSQWRGKASKIIKSIGKMEAAMALADASGFEALWIAEGIGPKLQTSPPETREHVNVAHDMSQARNYPDPPRLQWRNLMGANLTQPFELEVLDDALADEIGKGSIARFHAAGSREPVPGRPVLVRDRDGNHYLRDYQQGAGQRWKAVARKNGFSPMDSEEHGLTVVAVMKGVDWS